MGINVFILLYKLSCYIFFPFVWHLTDICVYYMHSYEKDIGNIGFDWPVTCMLGTTGEGEKWVGGCLFCLFFCVFFFFNLKNVFSL